MIIKLYTHKKFVKDGKSVISNNEQFFKRIILSDLNDTELKWLYWIDKAILIDKYKELILTPTGIKPIKSLSIGTKTLLNISYCLKYQVDFNFDITSCNSTILNILFDFIEGSQIKFVLKHHDIESIEEGFEFTINDNIQVSDKSTLISLLEGGA